jgi:DNA-binding MarR family transcriptional regulator
MTDKPAASRRPRLLYLVKRCYTVVKTRLDEVTRVHDLSGGEYTMLSFLKSLGVCSAADLARAARITPQAATQQVIALEAKGMVRRYENDANRRISLTELTELGLSKLIAINRGVDRIEREMLAGLSAEEIEVIYAFMGRTSAYADPPAD